MEVQVTETAVIVQCVGGRNTVLDYQELLLDPGLQVLGMYQLPTLGKIYYYYFYVSSFRIIHSINSFGCYFKSC